MLVSVGVIATIVGVISGSDRNDSRCGSDRNDNG